MVKSTKPQMVCVKWQDAHSPGATDVYNINDIGNVHGSLTMRTLGWLLKSDNVGVTLACEDCGDGDFRGLTHVSAAMLISLTPLKEVVAKLKTVPKIPPSPLPTP
jgi:hypothetical protein